MWVKAMLWCAKWEMRIRGSWTGFWQGYRRETQEQNIVKHIDKLVAEHEKDPVKPQADTGDKHGD